MSLRLYESAWVVVEGAAQPVQVHRDPVNRAAFQVGDFQYDIDARPLPVHSGAPAILSILDLQASREAGLPSNYGRDIDTEPSRRNR